MTATTICAPASMAASASSTASPRASRRIGRSFGMVATPGFPDIRVYVDNREVGRTDKAGYLMLPALRPYESNRVRLEVEDLPLDARIGSAEAVAVPYDRSGVAIDFDVKRERQATARLVDGSARAVAGRAAAGECRRRCIGLGGQGRLLADRRRRSAGRGDGRRRCAPLELPIAAGPGRDDPARSGGDRLPMKAVAAFLALSALLVPGPALALCGVQLQGVSFGSIDVMRREESTGSIRVTCDRAVGFNVEIGGSVSRRPAADAGGRRRVAPLRALWRSGAFSRLGRRPDDRLAARGRQRWLARTDLHHLWRRSRHSPVRFRAFTSMRHW